MLGIQEIFFNFVAPGVTYWDLDQTYLPVSSQKEVRLSNPYISTVSVSVSIQWIPRKESKFCFYTFFKNHLFVLYSKIIGVIMKLVIELSWIQ